MAQHKLNELEIVSGPSKLELMLSLFDTSRGPLIVTFHTINDSYKVQILSVQRKDRNAEKWRVEGVIQPTGQDIAIYYASDTRKGYFRLRSDLSNNDKSETLMIIMHRMIALYQNSHRDNLNDDIFVLFEKAKSVLIAADREAFLEAIKGI